MSEKKGLSSAFSDGEFRVRDALGGPRGIVESLAPTFVFLVAYIATRDAVIASVGAVVVVVALIIARVVQKQSILSLIHI